MAKMNLKEERESRGLSQSELAKLSGVSRATIWLIETEPKHEIGVNTAKSIAKVLGIDWKRFFAS